MEYLKKDESLIQRDEHGDVIPVEIELEYLSGKKIKVTPLLKGEIQKIQSASDEEKKTLDNEIILNHCKEPLFTKEEIEYMKLEIFGAIITGILSISLGVTQKQLHDSTTKEIISELDLKKKN